MYIHMLYIEKKSNWTEQEYSYGITNVVIKTNLNQHTHPYQILYEI